MSLSSVFCNRLTVATVACLLLGSVPPCHSQSPSPKVAHAVRVTSDRALRIDGALDDIAWSRAPIISDFVQKIPNEGATPSVSTEVRLLYDDDALYIGARLRRTDPNAIRTSVTRRDAESDAEVFTVSLDTYLDRRTAYSFSISSGGVRGDFYRAQDSEDSGRESQFDPVWSARTRVDAEGWTAELRIPFSQLRFNAEERHVWGLELTRTVPDKSERIQWVLIPVAAAGFASPSSRLFGPKPPKYMRTSSRPTAVAYDVKTTARTNRPLRRPSGNTRKTVIKSTGGTRSSACPTVCKTPLVAHPSVDTKLTKPHAIISGPKRLPGRRRHAKSPQSTYESVRKAVSTAITRGAPIATPTSSPTTASVNDVAAAAHPTIAIDHKSDARGARANSTLAWGATAEAAIALTTFYPRSSRSGRNLSGPTAHASRATDADERRRLHDDTPPG
jgi:hypothetical protein